MNSTKAFYHLRRFFFPLIDVFIQFRNVAEIAWPKRFRLWKSRLENVQNSQSWQNVSIEQRNASYMNYQIFLDADLSEEVFFRNIKILLFLQLIYFASVFTLTVAIIKKNGKASILTPLNPNFVYFYLVSLGVTGVYIIFLILLNPIDCGYSLEPPRRGGSNRYPQSMFWEKSEKNIRFCFMKILIFWW